MKTGQRFDVVVAFLSSARFVTALSTTTVGAAAFSFLLRQTIGWAGLLGILGGLLALWTIVLISKRGEVEWGGLLPISLMAFVGWAIASFFWSRYPLDSLTSIAYLLIFTVLGIAVALLRDTIQIVRSFGDVLRAALLVSLVLEIVSGLLLDAPIRFLSIAGNLDHLGPIQGIVGARNQLGLLSMVAICTFVIEWRTKSVRRGVAVGSVLGAIACLALSQSPIAMGSTLVVGLATLALYGLRRTSPERRRFWQITLLATTVVGAVLAWIFRSRVIELLDANKELEYRLNLWRRVWDLIPLHSLEGWGWIGGWHPDLVPFIGLQSIPGGAPDSAANVFLDVWLQLGLVGLVAFLGLVGLAFVRSWLLAVSKRSVVFSWSALVLLTLIMASFAESSILVEFGWLTLVVCTVKASRELSWRQALATEPPALLP